jgi:divalent metal cation (Fe/Co/Zn/Cd) transporter
MKGIGWLAVVPFIGIFGGPIFHNSVTPFIFGMPFILAWIVLWVLISSAVMAVIYRLDPAARGPQE